MFKKVFTISFLLLSAASAYAVTIPTADLPGAQAQDNALPFAPKLSQPSGKKPLLQTEKQKPTAKKQKEKTLDIKVIEFHGVIPHPKYGITTDQLKQLAAELLEKAKNKKGEVTTNQLQKIAAKLTGYYRKQGFILNKVYIPRQKVGRERILIMQVQEGVLGAIRVEGSSIYSTSELEKPFKGLVGTTVHARELESALYTLNVNYPGLKVTGVFEPGKKAGQTTLVIKVLKSERYQVGYSYDNNTSESTGKYRSELILEAYGLTFAPDVLQVKLMQKTAPSLSQYGSVAYQHRFFWPKTLWTMGYSYNKYDLGGDLESLKIYGDSKTGYLSLDHMFVENRTNLFGGALKLTRFRGVLKQNGSFLNKDDLTIGEASIGFTRKSQGWQNAIMAYLTYDHGFNNLLGAMGKNPNTAPVPTRQSVDGEYASGRFNVTKVSLGFNQHLTNYFNVILGVTAQYSPDILTSYNQLSLGGPFSMPGYATNEYLMDSGMLANLNVYFPLWPFQNKHAFGNYTWGQLIQFNLFSDYANAFLNKPTSSDTEHAYPADYGAGITLKIYPYFSFYFRAGRPYEYSVTAADGRKIRYWGGVQFSYRG